MSKKREILALPADPGKPFSSVVAFDALVFVSGTVGTNPESGKIEDGDMYAQTRQTLKNIENQLGKANLSLENALKVTVLITDMQQVKEMNRAYREVFRNDKPARSCCEVRALPNPEALVEIEIIAHR